MRKNEEQWFNVISFKIIPSFISDEFIWLNYIAIPCHTDYPEAASGDAVTLPHLHFPQAVGIPANHCDTPEATINGYTMMAPQHTLFPTLHTSSTSHPSFPTRHLSKDTI